MQSDHGSLLPGLGTADEREELNRIMETIPEQTPPPVREGVAEKEGKMHIDLWMGIRL
jgi:hypothetical protein